jgi:phosphoserine phosphatase
MSTRPALRRADAPTGQDVPTLLLTLTGPDRPGVSTRLFRALCADGEDQLAVIDIEQVVVRGMLVLGVLLAPAPASGPASDSAADPTADRHRLDTAAATAQRVADDLGLALEASTGWGDPLPSRRGRVVVTVLGAPLTPSAVAGITAQIAESGANIDRITRLAAYPVTSIRMHLSGADATLLRPTLASAAVGLSVDVAVESAGLHQRASRLVVMDVDSTLVQGEVIEMLAAQAGVLPQVAEVTEAAMRGELDFEQSLRARVALLAGLSASALNEVRRDVVLTPGARTLVRTLKRLGYRFAIVSGGFTQVTDHLAVELGIDYAAANTLEVVDSHLTGRLVGPVVDRAGKADALRRFAAQAGVPLSQTVAIGDGANDLDMIAAAGLGVAFNAKPVVRAAADTAVSVPYLDSILYLLGVSREDVEAADEADGTPTPAPSIG